MISEETREEGALLAGAVHEGEKALHDLHAIEAVFQSDGWAVLEQMYRKRLAETYRLMEKAATIEQVKQFVGRLEVYRDFVALPERVKAQIQSATAELDAREAARKEYHRAGC